MRRLLTACSMFFLALTLIGCVTPKRTPATGGQLDYPGDCVKLYDPTAMLTFDGEVTAVKEMNLGKGCAKCLSLEIREGTVKRNVYLGPSAFLDRVGFAFAPGDRISITGSRVILGESEMIIASEVVKDGRRLRIRNERGVHL